ncbi:MAG: SRPBCC family protein [Thiohalocapsa sp.]
MRSATAGEPGTVGIELQRRFRASPETLFEAWTTPAALRQWWCPPGWSAGDIEIDLRVGGSYRIAMLQSGRHAPVAVVGEFLDVQPPYRLVYTWRWEGAFPELPPTLVTLELQPSEGETLLVLRHVNFADAALREQHRTGWIAACNRLDFAVTPPQR